ncbi:hypothetical protein L2Z53_00450 [Macrococcoides canis]|uniref:hypothetical protein n=1 Tax=Macrococcoides canis TaxID=1855823 RepID=UPI001F17A952|nr:hypothetical protein [Macrococcus canis]UJS27862.1 hypothetical protein L2Z53_00450 [Macrococcus canis]
MKINNLALITGLSFAISMSIVFYQTLGITGIVIGLIFGISMTWAFIEYDKEDQEDEDE